MGEFSNSHQSAVLPMWAAGDWSVVGGSSSGGRPFWPFWILAFTSVKCGFVGNDTWDSWYSWISNK